MIRISMHFYVDIEKNSLLAQICLLHFHISNNAIFQPTHSILYANLDVHLSLN